jgi:hypothetical protein
VELKDWDGGEELAERAFSSMIHGPNPEIQDYLFEGAFLSGLGGRSDGSFEGWVDARLGRRADPARIEAALADIEDTVRRFEVRDRYDEMMVEYRAALSHMFANDLMPREPYVHLGLSQEKPHGAGEMYFQFGSEWGGWRVQVWLFRNLYPPADAAVDAFREARQAAHVSLRELALLW